MSLDSNEKVFVVHIANFSFEITIYLACKAQIALMKAKKASITIPLEYSDFADIYSEKFAAVLPEHNKTNDHAIDLKEGKQPSYRFIYS